MYLKNLYNYNKLLFSLVITFVGAQVFVILIWGIVITPFFNYGMFSEKMDIKTSYKVFEVEVNGEKLMGQNYSAQQWDKIILPLQFFADIKKSNQLYRQDIKRLLHKLSLQAEDENYLSTCDYPQFEEHYKNYLAGIIKRPIESLKLSYHLYSFGSHKLQPTDSIISLSQLCH